MKSQIKTLLAYSWYDVENMNRSGLIGPKAWRAYQRVWEWVNFRLSETYGRKQEIMWKEKGKASVYAKINKTRAAFGFAPLKGIQ